MTVLEYIYWEEKQNWIGGPESPKPHPNGEALWGIRVGGGRGGGGRGDEGRLSICVILYNVSDAS